MKIKRVKATNKIPCYGCIFFGKLSCLVADIDKIVCHGGGQEYIFIIEEEEDES